MMIMSNEIQCNTKGGYVYDLNLYKWNELCPEFISSLGLVLLDKTAGCVSNSQMKSIMYLHSKILLCIKRCRCIYNISFMYLCSTVPARKSRMCWSQVKNLWFIWCRWFISDIFVFVIDYAISFLHCLSFLFWMFRPSWINNTIHSFLNCISFFFSSFVESIYEMPKLWIDTRYEAVYLVMKLFKSFYGNLFIPCICVKV